MSLRALIFDFDGTLVDSFTPTIDAFAETIAAHGYPPVERELLRTLIGTPLTEVFRIAAPGSDASEMTATLSGIERVKAAAGAIKPFPGAVAVIDTLQAAGYTLAIGSSRAAESIETILTREQLREAFAVVIGRDELIHLKPHPEVIHRVCELLDCETSEAAYIGDTIHDLEAARNAGVQFFGVLTGLLTHEECETHGVPYATTLADLPHLLTPVYAH